MVARNPDPDGQASPLEEALELLEKAEATMRAADVSAEMMRNELSFTPEQADVATISTIIMAMRATGRMDDLTFGLMMLVRKLQREAL